MINHLANARYAPEGADTIRDHDQRRTLPLIEAELRLAKLTHEAAMAEPRVGRILARDAVSLERAIKQCRQPAAEPARWSWPFNQHRRIP